MRINLTEARCTDSGNVQSARGSRYNVPLSVGERVDIMLVVLTTTTNNPSKSECHTRTNSPVLAIRKVLAQQEEARNSCYLGGLSTYSSFPHFC